MLEITARRFFRTDPKRDLAEDTIPSVCPYCFFFFCTSTAPYPEPEDPSLCFDKGIENFLVHDEIFHYTQEVDTPSSLKRLVLCWMWNRLISLPFSMPR